MRIAFADDHALVRDGFKPFLAQLSDTVELVEAETFGGVIDKIEKVGGADLCILDLRMPDMEPLRGLEAVISAFPGMKLAVLSSITDSRTIKEVLKRGARGYIPKKLGIDSIIAALRLILGGETFVPALLLNGREAKPEELGNFTARECHVLSLLREGMSNKSIARRLNISEVTVKTHLTNAFRKLDVQNRVQAARAWQAHLD